MATYRQQKYDIALNGQGFILASKPETPAIVAQQDTVFGNRFAQGDRSYTDFSKWWYMAQTDWLGGFKESLSWADDAKFLYSTNIDAYSEPGAIKLFKKPTLDNDFTATLVCGTEGTVNSNFRKYVGMSSDAIFEYTTSWGDISSATFPAGITEISQLLTRQNYLWAMNVGTDGTTTHILAQYDGTNWVDNTPFIEDATVLNYAVVTAHCAVEIGTTLYVAVSGTANQIAIVKTTATAPSAATDWVNPVINRTQAGKIVDMGEYQGNLYYLIRFANGLYELRKYNIATSSDGTIGMIRTTNASTSPTTGIGGRLLLTIAGKLVILLPKAIWEWNATTLSRVWQWTNDKNNVDVDANGNTLKGGVISDNKIFADNIIYDGTYLYNWIKRLSDVANGVNYPIFTDSTDTIYLFDDTDTTKLNKIDTTSSNYKGTADKNYLVFSNFDLISGIDKLAYSVTLNFRTLASGQKIAVEYATGEISTSTTWTALGNANFTSDGAVITKKLYFGDAVLFKKIWFRVKLEAGGSDTPSMTDFIFEYLPMPDYKLAWNFTVKCVDEIQRKDQTKETKTGLWLRNLLRNAWWTKSVLSYEDYDAMAKELVDGALTAAATTIPVQNSTDNFPERGRILIGSEEILYNGKNKKQFLDCTRGARGTVAATHSDGNTVSTAYRVIIRDYKEQLIIANSPIQAEYLVTLQISEV